jgi:preprotein translocase subunit SecG
MATIISILIVLVCLLLIMVVLVQNSKGGGLASSFSSSNQVMGVRKTADFLEKATWTLAVALLALSLISTAYTKPQEGEINTSTSTTRKMSSDAPPAPAANQNTSAPVVPQKNTTK